MAGQRGNPNWIKKKAIPAAVEEGSDVAVLEAPRADSGARIRKVRWTKAGEDAGTFAEDGQHKAGDLVETEHWQVFIERGHAELPK